MVIKIITKHFTTGSKYIRPSALKTRWMSKYSPYNVLNNITKYINVNINGLLYKIYIACLTIQCIQCLTIECIQCLEIQIVYIVYNVFRWRCCLCPVVSRASSPASSPSPSRFCFLPCMHVFLDCLCSISLVFLWIFFFFAISLVFLNFKFIKVLYVVVISC